MDEINTTDSEASEFDWDSNQQEIEDSLKEVNYWSFQIDESCDWIDLLSCMEEDLHRFKKNMESILLSFPTLESSKVEESQFLRGIIFTGIISAYEACVHDLFITILKKPSNSNLAITQISKLSKEEKRQLRIKDCKTDDELKEALAKATLHNPNLISKMSATLFNFNLPKLPEPLCEKILQIRNDYTHNGGYNETKRHPIPFSDINFIFRLICELIDSYHNYILKLSDDFLNMDHSTQT